MSGVQNWVTERREWLCGQNVGCQKGESVQRGRWTRVGMRKWCGREGYECRREGRKEWVEKDRGERRGLGRERVDVREKDGEK